MQFTNEKWKAKKKTNKTTIEKPEELQTLRQRIQSLGRPVLPQSLIQQSLSDQVRLNGKENMTPRSFSNHKEDKIEEERYVGTAPENDSELVGNAAEIDDGFEDTEYYEPIPVDENFCHKTDLRCSYDCRSPRYENPPKRSWAPTNDKENESPDSGFASQETYDDVCSCLDESVEGKVYPSHLPQRPWADTNQNEELRPDSRLDFEDSEFYDEICSYEDEPLYETVGNQMI